MAVHRELRQARRSMRTAVSSVGMSSMMVGMATLSRHSDDGRIMHLPSTGEEKLGRGHAQRRNRTGATNADRGSAHSADAEQVLSERGLPKKFRAGRRWGSKRFHGEWRSAKKPLLGSVYRSHAGHAELLGRSAKKTDLAEIAVVVRPQVDWCDRK
eukprot:3921971-Pleurochrysis_carterae.AAC.1